MYVHDKFVLGIFDDIRSYTNFLLYIFLLTSITLGFPALESICFTNYSWLPITRTLANLNLLLTRSNFHLTSGHFLQLTLDNSNPSNLNLPLSYFHLPSGHFPFNLTSITRSSDNSNLFLFLLKVRVIVSRLYIILHSITRTLSYYLSRFELSGVDCASLIILHFTQCITLILNSFYIKNALITI